MRERMKIYEILSWLDKENIFVTLANKYIGGEIITTASGIRQIQTFVRAYKQAKSEQPNASVVCSNIIYYVLDFIG